jgi:hypothetical protein
MGIAAIVGLARKITTPLPQLDAQNNCTRERIRLGGLYICDNVLGSGYVVDSPSEEDLHAEWTEAIREHNRLITACRRRRYLVAARLAHELARRRPAKRSQASGSKTSAAWISPSASLRDHVDQRGLTALDHGNCLLQRRT